MKRPQVTFGGGNISPAVIRHLRKVASVKSEKTKPDVQFGGGAISPSVRKHMRRAMAKTK